MLKLIFKDIKEYIFEKWGTKKIYIFIFMNFEKYIIVMTKKHSK